MGDDGLWPGLIAHVNEFYKKSVGPKYELGHWSCCLPSEQQVLQQLSQVTPAHKHSHSNDVH